MGVVIKQTFRVNCKMSIIFIIIIESKAEPISYFEHSHKKNSLETNNRPLFYVFVSIMNLGPSFPSAQNF